MAYLALALHAHTRMSFGWTTEETRALVGVWGLSYCPEQARWNGAEPLHLRKNHLSLETLSTLCILRNRRKAHSNTSSTATRRGTIDGRDASLLSMVELAFFTRRTARALQSRDIRRRGVDVRLREKCSERDECALPRSGFKPVRMRFDFWCTRLKTPSLEKRGYFLFMWPQTET